MGDLGSIPGLGRSPGGGHGNPLKYSCLENPHGQRSLAGFSPWGCNESDTTEGLSTQQTTMLDVHLILIYKVHITIEGTEAQITFLKSQVVTGKRS